jgi:hypothetical protein
MRLCTDCRKYPTTRIKEPKDRLPLWTFREPLGLSHHPRCAFCELSELCLWDDRKRRTKSRLPQKLQGKISIEVKLAAVGVVSEAQSLLGLLSVAVSFAV